MALTQRERKIAIGVGALLGVYLLYSYPVSGYLSRRSDLKTKIEARTKELDEADNLAARRRELEETTWKYLVNAGLAENRAMADSQLGQMLSEWSRETGLTISASRSEQPGGSGSSLQSSPAAKAGFHEVKALATARGSQAGLATLLWRLETTKVPIRINEITITAPKEGEDRLNVQMGISTLALSPESAAVVRPTAGRNP